MNKPTAAIQNVSEQSSTYHFKHVGTYDKGIQLVYMKQNARKVFTKVALTFSLSWVLGIIEPLSYSHRA